MAHHALLGFVGVAAPIVVLVLVASDRIPFALGAGIAVVVVAIAVAVNAWLDDRSVAVDHFSVETELSCAERGVRLEDAGH